MFSLITNFESYKIYIASSAITFAVFLFLAVVTDGSIGGGDIKLLTALAPHIRNGSLPEHLPWQPVY